LFAVLLLLRDLNDVKVDTILVSRSVHLRGSNTSQRVRKSPMAKPDKVLRTRPLKEAGPAVAKLKRVVLFHPDPIVVEEPATYCVCKKGEVRRKKDSAEMIQCETCCEWFHFDCVGIEDGTDLGDSKWTCEWCRDVADREGYHRWRSRGKKVVKRHRLDAPVHQGVALGQDKPPKLSAPRSWDEKVEKVREAARRAAIKKKKLVDAVERLVDLGGHHSVDAEGMAGLEARPVDDGLVDEMIEAGLVDADDFDENE
jgi:hypothetical protein